MKASRKRAARLAARIQDWEDIKLGPADGVKGSSKMIRGYAFRKPGSEKK